ncbi:uncharacterized protein MYCFIDRAFT_174831 [Pseudocercospora fijiensis CIRAD86]|uniref:Uncharacterized protein n=1 Tax=Pseudocercospora fijiensis (strain CIRAD86) TaxID=383855 RepID=M3B1U4_PSEFD|nr:uncharacterized protein MYCFIDRAFT_174831 [Pseudocercospora fijiensis CIRAD86]EME83382.1 hypothetical protein MYCFIDRAFT_174831 [Pseudocercospora fijiensis CIRAD86]
MQAVREKAIDLLGKLSDSGIGMQRVAVAVVEKTIDLLGKLFDSGIGSGSLQLLSPVTMVGEVRGLAPEDKRQPGQKNSCAANMLRLRMPIYKRGKGGNFRRDIVVVTSSSRWEICVPFAERPCQIILFCFSTALRLQLGHGYAQVAERCVEVVCSRSGRPLAPPSEGQPRDICDVQY